MKSFNEIDYIRSEWSKLSNSNLKNYRSKEEIESIAKQKSKNEIHKIKRKFIIESLVSIVLIMVAFVYIHKSQLYKEAIVFYSLVGVAIVFTLVLISPLLKVGKIDSQPIIWFLDHSIQLFKKVYRNLTLFGVIAAPIGFLAGVIGGIMHDAKDQALGEVLSTSKLIFISICFILFSIAGYYMVQYYYKLIYKKHIDNLENMLSELKQLEMEEDY